MAIDFPNSPTYGLLYRYGGVTYVYSTQGVWTTAGTSAVGIIGGSPQGRLTLQTVTPVMTSTQAAKTTIYYTPYVGDLVPIYDGTSMVMTTFSERSVATTDTSKSPAAIGASKVNDWFVWSDAGIVRLGHGPDWTNDTTRSAGTALVMVGGILLNSVSITNGPAASRGTYVGTTRSNASSQLDWIFGGLGAGGVAGFFGVGNAYNQVDVATMVQDSSDSWAYAATAWRPSDFDQGGAGTNLKMRVSFVDPLGTTAVLARKTDLAYNSGTLLTSIGIGVDTTTNYSGTTGTTSFSSSAYSSIVAYYGGIPGLGFRFVQAIESAGGGGTGNFRGDLGLPAYIQTGLIVSFKA